MALKIRLKRMGKKRNPFYRIVVADSKTPLVGRIVEQVGHYDPRRSEVFKVQEDRIQYWMGQGAKPSSAVLQLIKRAGKVKDRAKETIVEGTD